MKYARFYAVIACTLTLAACGGAPERMMERAIEKETGDDADVDMNDDGTMHIETEDGTYDSGNKVPADWPKDVAIYAGATVGFSGSVNPVTGQPGKVLTLTTTDNVDTVMTFYKTDLAANGWAVESVIQGGLSIISATKAGHTVGIMATEVDGQTSITIGIEEGVE